MSSVSMIASRFSVFKNGVRLGVIVPRNDGWAFVLTTAPFTFFTGKPHYHVLLLFGGVKSYDQVLELIKPLNCPT